MIISHKYKFIFIKTYKTAGTSIEVYFSQLAGEKDILTPIYPLEENHFPQHYKGWFDPLKESQKFHFSLKNRLKEFVLRRKFYNHIPAFLVKERITPNIWNSYFKFCVERNPWDKAVSHYHMVNYRSENKLDFRTYLQSPHSSYNYPLYNEYHKDNVLVDRILRYDKLNEELSEVFSDLGIPFEGKLTAFSKSNYRPKAIPYQEYYDEITKEVIRDKYRKEIELMKFEF